MTARVQRSEYNDREMFRMKKRIVAMGLCLLLLAGCGSKETVKNPESSVTASSDSSVVSAAESSSVAILEECTAGREHQQ